MADESDFSTSAQPTLQDLATFFVDEFFDVHRIARLETAIRNAHAEGATIAHAAQVQAAPNIGQKKRDFIDDAQGLAARFAAYACAKLVSHILGIEIDISTTAGAGGKPDDSPVGRALSDVVFRAIKGPEGEIQPSEEGARRLISMLSHITLTSWWEGILFEEGAALGGFLHAPEAIAHLGEDLVQALGLGRLARRALGPLVNATMTTPLQWQVNKTYTPNLLSEGEILKAFLRGDYSDSDAREELARLGYNDRRQEMLLKSAQKYVSTEDALLLMRHGGMSADEVTTRLRLQGHDAQELPFVFATDVIKRALRIYDNALPALQRAFVNRDISESQFGTLIPPELYDDSERELVLAQARLQREFNVRHMSEGEVVEAVRAAIVPMAFYRDWMTREGFPDDEQVVKELLLRSRIDKDFKADQARKDVETQRAAAAAKKQADADAKKQQLEQDRALARRGPLSELSRVAIRGLIPISRVVEVLSAQYDPDTVAIYVADIEAQHADYVAQQQAAEDARKRAAVQHVNVSQLEQAVLAGVLTLDEFRRQLSGLRFSAEDVALLTATLAARKKDLDAAKAKREQAAAVAKMKHIDLKTFETLVRRGHHTIADYQALLRSLDFDEPAIADMTQLLQIEMLDDANAAKTRADAAAKSAAKGVSIEQSRRAVLIGVQTVDDFDHILADAGYTVDARAVLVAELTHDLAEADAARQRRAAVDASLDPRALPLATIARAARLGIVPLDVYRQRLVDAGYSDDDVAIELDLLVHEIADVRAARQVQANADQAPAPSGLTLAQIAAAVKAGVRSLEDYRAAAITRGLALGDVVTLVRVLGDELANTTAAKARRAEIGSTVKAGDVSVGVLADEVRAGARSLGDYGVALEAAGLDPVDVDLLVALLGDELAGGTSG